MEWVVIAFAGFATAVLSALAGLGGGVVLLAVLAQYFVPQVAIPIHGGIQLVANGSRAFFLRQQVCWRTVGYSSILLIPASLLGVWAVGFVPVDATRLVLGLFLLVLVWRPAWLRWTPRHGISWGGLVGVGAVSGFLNTTVGASGPLTSPFIKAATQGHAAFVATAAAAQVIAHASKVAAYTWDGFSLSQFAGVIALGAASAALGSWVGTRWIGRVSEARLTTLFRTVLTVLALRLVIRALL